MARWLGGNGPDDAEGTKTRQILAAARGIAAVRGLPLDRIMLWVDFAVVDQHNPMPAIQLLPVYIACADEFVYIAHSNYWERAWCLTEQYMSWRLLAAQTKYQLAPVPPATGANGGDGHAGLVLLPEPVDVRPPDPSLGKLSVEADRVALVTLASLVPYNT